MKTIKQKTYGDVSSWELGVSFIGKPLMTSIFYMLDGLVIDTGIAHMRKDVLGLLEDRKPQKVLLTHCHEDHSANALAIQDRFKVDVLGHPYTVVKMARKQIILPYQRLLWGKSQRLEMVEVPAIIESNQYRLQPIPTPGHSKDHTVYLEEENGWLFSGDLYLADKIKYFRADENIYDQLCSLKNILTFEFDTLFCGHNPQTENVKQKLQTKLDYLENFVGEIQGLLDNGMLEKEIIEARDRKDDWMIKRFTMGNMSFANMVQTTVHHRPLEN